MKYLITSLFLLCSTLIAADFSGKWAGNYDVTMTDGQAMKGKVTLNLTQSGAELTGTAGSEDNQMPILNGKVDGDKLTFDVQTEGPKMMFELRLEDGHLRGNAKGMADGTTVSVKLDLTKN
jgi:hypothetical protein